MNSYNNTSDPKDPPIIKNFLKVQEQSGALKMSNLNRKQEKDIWSMRNRLLANKKEDLLIGKAKESAKERRLKRLRKDKAKSFASRNIHLEKY